MIQSYGQTVWPPDAVHDCGFPEHTCHILGGGGARLFKLLKTITAVLKFILLCRSIHPNLASRMQLLFSGSLMPYPSHPEWLRQLAFVQAQDYGHGVSYPIL